MASRKEDPGLFALVSLGSRQPLYVICASRPEIQTANLRLWQGDLPMRYVPWRQP